MKDAGCRLLIVGFESGDQQILKNIKKGATIERARQFAKDCKKLGLAVHGDFILGLPGETKETIRKTIDFAKELNVETIQVSVAHAYPGTELYDYAKANGLYHQPAADGRLRRTSVGAYRVSRLARRLRPGDDPPLLRRILFPSEGVGSHRFQGHVERR